MGQAYASNRITAAVTLTKSMQLATTSNWTQRTGYLHLGLELLGQLLQLLLAWALLLPTDTETFLLVRLGNHVEVNVVNFLVGVATVVLENVVLLGARGYGDLLQDGLFHATC